MFGRTAPMPESPFSSSAQSELYLISVVMHVATALSLPATAAGCQIGTCSPERSHHEPVNQPGCVSAVPTPEQGQTTNGLVTRLWRRSLQVRTDCQGQHFGDIYGSIGHAHRCHSCVRGSTVVQLGCGDRDQEERREQNCLNFGLESATRRGKQICGDPPGSDTRQCREAEGTAHCRGRC